MGKRDDGGPAFPLDRVAGSVNCGMTLRQWYKGMALIGWMSANVGRGTVNADQVIMQVSNLADALIAEDKEATK